MKGTIHFSIQSKGRILDLSTPTIMGILNVTPDSFFEGSRLTKLDELVATGQGMVKDGAKVLDIGGVSSRPGASHVSMADELKRVIPAIGALRNAIPDTWISIDTCRSQVAKEAILAGADIVNDISAGELDDQMFATVASLGCPYILMHMKGTPVTMQINPEYDDVVQEVLQYFITKVDQLRKLGVYDLIIDPGFGFGKTIDHNFTLLKGMHILNLLDSPVLCGLSRKSFIYKTLETSPLTALNGTSALHMVALQQGAKILRVHDVKEANEVIQLFAKL